MGRDADSPRIHRFASMAARAGVTAAVILAVVTAGVGTALAAGNAATLQGDILTNPVPGWSPVPLADIQSGQYGPSTQLFATLANQTNQSIAMAPAGWNGPGQKALIITLIQFSGSSVPQSANVPLATNLVCTGSGFSTGPLGTIPGIPNSASETCPGSVPPTISTAWIQGNIIAFVNTIGLSMAAADSISRAQDAKLLSAGGGGGSGLSGAHDVGLYVGVGVAVLAVSAAAAATWYLRRRSRKKAPVRVVPAGVPAPELAQPHWETGPATKRPGFRLVASGLRLHLGERQLLDDVDLEVSPASLVAITGPSGAGKTSLLMVLSGVLEPDAGRVELLPTAR